MIDQTRVTSGYDAEALLSERYLSHLLLVACDAGIVPTELTFADVTLRLQPPADLDRTYEPAPGAPTFVDDPAADAFAVTLLTGHPTGANLQVTLRLTAEQASTGISVSDLDLQLFARIGYTSTTSPDGVLETASLSLTLVDIAGGLVVLAGGASTPISKDEILAELAPRVDRTFDLAGLGSAGRLADLAIRIFPAGATAPAALGVYANLRLRSAPHPDSFLPPRGDVLAGQDFRVVDASDPMDLTFATRPTIYRDLARDAKFRRAEPTQDGYSYPILDGDARIVDISVSALPDDAHGPRNTLKIDVEGEYFLNNLPDPNFDVNTLLRLSTDDEDILHWDAGLDVDTSIYAEIVFGIVAGLAGLIVGLVAGPGAAVVTITATIAGLEAALYTAEEIVSELKEEKAQRRVDATLMDVAPNRLTVLHRRWDPFFDTAHQIGLRAGGSLINDDGLALWGRAALTHAAAPPVPRVVIREAVLDTEDTAVALRYLVTDVGPSRDLLGTTAPATVRGEFSQPDPVGEPDLFEVTVDDAIARVAAGRLRGAHPYSLEGIDAGRGHFVLISVQERDAVEARLRSDHETAARPRIVADNADRVRAEVLADFAAAGVIATEEQVVAEVDRRLEVLVAEDLAAYEADGLPADLSAAIAPLLRLVLPTTDVAKLVKAHVIELENADDLQLVEMRNGRAYYRHRFSLDERHPPRTPLEDNLHHLPRFRRRPGGVVMVDAG